MDYKVKCKELLQMLNTDSLTNLLSRRYIDENFEQIIVSKKQSSEINLALIDIDYFKKINDVFGHIAGDNVLKQFAELLKNQLVLSENDYLARYGGDEFILLSTDISYEDFILRIKKCLRHISDYKFLINEESISISASAGCTNLQCAGEKSFCSILNDADKKLYEAKHCGRDRMKI